MAEKQIKAYAERIDQLEDDALNCMDQLETMQRDLGIVAESIDYATRKYGESLSNFSHLESTLLPEQDSLESDLEHHSIDSG